MTKSNAIDYTVYSRDGVNAELRKSRGQATLETVPATNVTLPMKPTRSKGSIDFSYRAHRVSTLKTYSFDVHSQFKKAGFIG